MRFSRPSRALLPALALLVTCAGLSLDPGGAAADDLGGVNSMSGDTAGGPTEMTRARSVTVTLVTGDRVTLQPRAGDGPGVVFESRDSAEPGGFTVERDDEGIHVVPSDVAGLVPEVLDPELFNVTRLAEMGYDDDSTGVLPLIVDRAPGARRLTSRSIPFVANAELSSIGATAVTLAKSEAGELGERLASVPFGRGASAARRALGGASTIHLDGKVTGSSVDAYLDLVNAPEAWNTGLDGSGVKVAVLDSGVDEGHPALVGQVESARNFTDEVDAEDEVGHGTHVASLLAGTGAGADGARQGIAPGADLLAGRVLNSENEGLESWVIAGTEWAVAQGADIVNLSLGGPPAERDDPVVRSLEELTKRSDALFVVSAGNRGDIGRSGYTINSPGTAPSALTVGAARPDGAQAVFSSEGPTTGSYLVKPDVLAPGVDVLGAKAGARQGDLYVPMSGTSMATPIVAGAVALLKQAHPAWTAEELKARIVTTADGSTWFNSWSEGSGRLDLAAATSVPVVADVANLDLGYLAHPDETVQRQTVTVRNTGSQPVTLSVLDTMTNDTYGMDGNLEEAPASAVTADPSVLEIPAGSSAQTVIALDPVELSDTIWQGVVTFQAQGRDVLRLPIGVYDEPASYDLDVEVLDRNGDPYDPAHADGEPHARTFAYAMNATTGDGYPIELDAEGHGTARVRAGHYSVFAHVATPAAGGAPASTTFAGTAEMLVDADTTRVIDARDGVRLDELSVEGRRTRATEAVGFTYHRETADGRALTVGEPLEPELVRQGRIFITPTAPVTTGIFEAALRWQLRPEGRGRPHDPDVYDVVWNGPALTAEMSPPLRRDDVRSMAQLHQTVHPAATSGAHALVTQNLTRETGLGWVFAEDVDLPASRTVLATAAPDVTWQHCLEIEWNWWRDLCRGAESLEPGGRDDIEIGGAVHAAAVESDRYPDGISVATGYSDGRHRMKVANGDVVKRSLLTLATPTGDELGSVDGFSGYFPVSEQQEWFRLTHVWTLDARQLRVARESRTVWDFRAVPGEVPTLLDAEYGPALQASGRARPRHPLALDLSFEPAEPESATPVDRITRAEMWWSTDGGAVWQRLPVRRTSNTGFAAKVPARVLAPGVDLSLRVSAADDRGTSVDQTSIGLIAVARS